MKISESLNRSLKIFSEWEFAEQGDQRPDPSAERFRRAGIHSKACLAHSG